MSQLNSPQLDSKLLQEHVQRLSGVESAIDIVVLERVFSTNDWAMQQCRQGRQLPFVCFAEQQTAGRGRRGKRWLGGRAANIMMTLVWPFALEHTTMQWLPLMFAMAVVRALETLGMDDIQVKWPNDVLVENKKIAGILLETSALANGKRAIVTGIGLNYDISALRNAIPAAAMPVTDVCTMQNKHVHHRDVRLAKVVSSRNEVAAVLLESCINFCKNFPANRVAVRDEFLKQHDYCRGKLLDIMLADGTKLTGTGAGLDEQAALVVQIDHQQRVFHSAEVSVRAL